MNIIKTSKIRNYASETSHNLTNQQPYIYRPTVCILYRPSSSIKFQFVHISFFYYYYFYSRESTNHFNIRNKKNVYAVNMKMLYRMKLDFILHSCYFFFTREKRCFYNWKYTWDIRAHCLNALLLQQFCKCFYFILTGDPWNVFFSILTCENND